MVVVRYRCLVHHRWSRVPRGVGVVCFVNVWGFIGDERFRDGRATGGSRRGDVAETVRKVVVGVVVWRVGASNVLCVGAGSVGENSVVVDRVR